MVDKNQDPRARQTLHHAIEDRLRLGVDPVQILENDHQRLDLALAQEEPPHGVERAVPPLRRIQDLPLPVVHGEVEQGQQRRVEATVEAEELGGGLFSDSPWSVAILDLKVVLEKIDHRKIWRRLAIRDSTRSQDQPAAGAVGAGQFPHEPRLSHTGVADDRYQLASPTRRPGERLMKLTELSIPADQARKTPHGRRLEPRAPRLRSGHFVGLDQGRQPLDGHRAERTHAHVTFHQLQGRTREEDAARPRQLAHSRRPMRGLANGRVVQLGITTDGAHHDLARIEPDLDLEVHAASVVCLFGILPDQFLHPDCREAGPDGMVFLSQRRTEECHDPVARDLVHHALVAPDG